MSKNYLNELNIKKIRGSKIVANQQTYTVVSAKLMNKKLCLTLVDLNTAIKKYGVEKTKECVDTIRQAVPARIVDVIDEKYATLPYVVLQVYNPFMRGVNFHVNEKKYSTDYYIIGENMSEGQESIFRIYEESNEGEPIPVDPFINFKTGEPCYSLDEVNFPCGEIAMRELFAQALGENSEKFVRDFKNECLSVLYEQNAEYIKEQKRIVAEAKQKYAEEQAKLKKSRQVVSQYKSIRTNKELTK